MALAAMEKMAIGYCFNIQADKAVIVRYMVKLLGRRAVLEMNMPELNSRKHRVRRPVFAPNCLHIALKTETILYSSARQPVFFIFKVKVIQICSIVLKSLCTIQSS